MRNEKIKVLKISQFKNDSNSDDFYCNTFKNHLQEHHHAITAPHKHDFFLTVFFTQGTGIHEIDFNSYEIKPGSIFLLNPGQTHYWELSEDTDGFIFFHSQEFFDIEFTNHSIYDFPFFYSLLNPSVLYLNQLKKENTKTLFEELKEEYHHHYDLKKQRIRALLELLYVDLSRLYIQNSENNILEPNALYLHTRHLEQLIEKHFKTEKSATAYANMLHVSTRHLNRLTRNSIGKTTTQLITERVLLEAKRMLVHSNDSSTNIALTLGYEDYSYFSHLFKKWTTYTPSEFAKKYKLSNL